MTIRKSAGLLLLLVIVVTGPALPDSIAPDTAQHDEPAISAAELNSLRRIEDLEYLLARLDRRQINKVTHHFRHGAHWHYYFLSCEVIDGKESYLGLVSSDWQRCHILTKAMKLSKRKDFSHLIKDDQALKTLRQLIFMFSSGKSPLGTWGSSDSVPWKGAPCLEFTPKKSVTHSSFCLHSEAAARDDWLREKTLFLTAFSIYMTIVVLPLLRVLL